MNVDSLFWTKVLIPWMKTLETALETLASLRQDGKLIEVISHVSALKERISTKILVQKGYGGKSIISGPGCSRVN